MVTSGGEWLHYYGVGTVQWLRQTAVGGRGKWGEEEAGG